MIIHFRMSVAFRNRNAMKRHCNSQQTTLNGPLPDQITFEKHFLFKAGKLLCKRCGFHGKYHTGLLLSTVSQHVEGLSVLVVHKTAGQRISLVDNPTSPQYWARCTQSTFPTLLHNKYQYLLNSAVPLFTFIYSKFSRRTEEFSQSPSTAMKLLFMSIHEYMCSALSMYSIVHKSQAVWRWL